MEAQTLTEKHWELFPLLPKEQFHAAEQAGITRLQAQLLTNRGMATIAEMQAFLSLDYQLSRDPLTLIDMPRALERIRLALLHGEHITVYGDYDADGVTSSSLLYRVLRNLKQPDAPLDYHIPHRLRDGCGLNLRALDLLKARGTQLIITTDCASSDVEQVEYARSLGMEVIITDHHHPPTELPRAYAMVNPWRSDCTYGERYLCGVGIAFKLAQALYRSFQRPVEDEMELLDLVAIGTIADVAPLLGENHLFVRLGMQQLNRTRKPGLRALIRNAGLQLGRIRERDIAFALAPRINAAGRMQEAGIAFDLMVTDNEVEAESIAGRLDQLNQARQQETENLMRHVREQAKNQKSSAVVLVDGDDWHEGIIGLVAGKLAEEIDKPVLVLSNDPKTQLSRGSARSRKGFNIIEALHGFGEQLERYGGHSQAAGFTIRHDRIEDLRRHLLNWREQANVQAGTLIEGTRLPDETGLVIDSEPEPAPPVQMVDLVFTRLERLTYELLQEIRSVGPFGAGNPEPVFKMEHLRLLDLWPSGASRQNLRLRLGTDRGSAQQAGTLSNGAAQRSRLRNATHVNIIFRLDAFEKEGQSPELWLKLLDVEAAEAPKA